MRTILALCIVFILQSCCSPHFVGYVNPLYLEPEGREVSCLLKPCRDGKACLNRPWLNTELEYSNVQSGKVGLSFLGYRTHSMVSFTTNFVSNLTYKNTTRGLGIEAQLGTFAKNNFFTTFAGIEYNRLWGTKSTHQFHPTIGFSPPLQFANSFQVKGGYQLNHNTSNFWTIGLNFKAPLLHYIFK